MFSTSLVFRIPQNGGVAREAVQRNTILFPLKAYSLWNLYKAATSVRWRCTTRQCWLNCRSTLQRNGHNFIGLDGDFIMTMHSLTSRFTSCSFWLNLTLPPYSSNLWLLLIPITKDKAPGQSIWDLWSSAEEKRGDSQGPDKESPTSCIRGMAATLYEVHSTVGGILWKRPRKH